MFNFTQHPATKEQIEAGVEEPAALVKEEIKQLLTFEGLPSAEEVQERADALANLAASMEAEGVLIGGAPWLMGPLTRALMLRGIAAFFAFSKRESKEVVLEDGTTKKTSVFQHLGFIPGELHRDDYYGDPIVERSFYSFFQGCSVERVY